MNMHQTGNTKHCSSDNEVCTILKCFVLFSYGVPCSSDKYVLNFFLFCFCLVSLHGD